MIFNNVAFNLLVSGLLLPRAKATAVPLRIKSQDAELAADIHSEAFTADVAGFLLL